MDEDILRRFGERFGLSLLGDTNSHSSVPVNLQLWKQAEDAYNKERGLIFIRAIKREIDPQQAKRLLSEVTDKIKATYTGLLMERPLEGSDGGALSDILLARRYVRELKAEDGLSSELDAKINKRGRGYIEHLAQILVLKDKA